MPSPAEQSLNASWRPPWLALGHLTIWGLQSSSSQGGEGHTATCGLAFCFTHPQCLRQDKSGDLELDVSLEQRPRSALRYGLGGERFPSYHTAILGAATATQPQSCCWALPAQGDHLDNVIPRRPLLQTALPLIKLLGQPRTGTMARCSGEDRVAEQGPGRSLPWWLCLQTITATRFRWKQQPHSSR